ncbi:hypothetical protein QR98_0013070 [Sarcoptes scabiei]|uniref:Uncharacterized protein n=1 Tax=Sarcoptes scabiei TaxID=52283 RepID=A0A131ZW52_SARSC|nr:hypothetical protein QR98_0013070 [Sarcoptes scabiei]
MNSGNNAIGYDYFNQDPFLEDENLTDEKCLPFGYFYDDDKEFNQLISSASITNSSSLSLSSNNSSPLFEDLYTPTQINSNGNFRIITFD